MDRIEADFLNATRNALAAGFDMLEIHLAHGYLLSSFISPYTNRRTDEYGGGIKNRARYPLRIVQTVRRAWPPERPISVRISATDWISDGLSGQDLTALVHLLKENGADIINVSTGQVVSHEEPVYGRMYQAPFADRIRNEMGMPTIVAGNITSADQVNTLVAAGRTDLVALARPIMNEPQFVLNAAARYGYREQYWPDQYAARKFAAEMNAERINREEIELRTNAKPPDPQEMLAVAIARGEVLSD